MFQNKKIPCYFCIQLLLIGTILCTFYLCRFKDLQKTTDEQTTIILDRSKWHGEPPKSNYDRLQTPIANIIICHTATESCEDEVTCAYRTEVIQRFHMHSFGWNDIGYNFLVGGDGHVYMGRGWDVQGRHLNGFGSTTLSIAFIGTFINTKPLAKQINAAQWLLAEGIRLNKITPDYRLYGARQFSATESPGESLYKIITSWPHFSFETHHLSKKNANSLKIVLRDYWLAQPMQNDLAQLQLPVKRVIVLPTQTDKCETQAECTFRVRFLQTYHIEALNKNDIIYNFLIGGDGNVYEGRGWKYADALIGNGKNESISIAFIGKYAKEQPSDKQLLAMNLLLKDGTDKSKLVMDYEIISAQQLNASNAELKADALYASLTTWTHWKA